MATDALPVARSVVVCEQIAPDATNPNRVSLLRVVSTIRPISDPPFPLLQRELAVFAQLTECRGAGRVWVQIQSADADAVLFRTQTRDVTFSNEPLLVRGLRFRILNLVFSEPGLYWVQLWYNDEMIGQLPVVVRPGSVT